MVAWANFGQQGRSSQWRPPTMKWTRLLISLKISLKQNSNNNCIVLVYIALFG